MSSDKKDIGDEAWKNKLGQWSNSLVKQLYLKTRDELFERLYSFVQKAADDNWDGSRLQLTVILEESLYNQIDELCQKFGTWTNNLLSCYKSRAYTLALKKDGYVRCVLSIELCAPQR